MRARRRGQLRDIPPRNPVPVMLAADCLGWRGSHKLSLRCPPVYMGEA